MSEMLFYIVNSINFSEIITTAIVMMIIYIISRIKPYALKILQCSIEYLTEKYEGTKYANMMNIAKDIWYKVEEDYRINEQLAEQYKSKREYFDSLILKAFPTLKVRDIELIRQAISGQNNQFKMNGSLLEIGHVESEKEVNK